MGLALADLITRLQGDVAQRGSVPSTTQYQQCAKDAVANYSRQRPMLRRTTIDVVSGTAEYELPVDFWQLVSLQSWGSADSVLIADAGLIPLPADFIEEWEVLGRTLVLHPTPAYSLSGRVVKYLALHVLSGEEGSEEYVYLTREDEDIFMKYAQALALGLIANAMAGKAADYSVRDVRETRSTPLKEVREQIKELRDEYKAALAEANRVMPVLGHGYTQAELEAWL